jgi:hypothetical protein
MEVGYLIAREREDGKWVLLEDFTFEELKVYDSAQEILDEILKGIKVSVKFTTLSAYQAELETVAPYLENMYV